MYLFLLEWHNINYVVTGIGTNGFIVSSYPKKMKGDK